MSVHELFAYLCVDNAAEAIEFYGKAFGARENFRLAEPNGRIGHAELDFGGATLMLSDEFPSYGVKGPDRRGPAAVTIHIHVDDTDEVVRRAVAAGATVEMEPADQFYGERSAIVRDPYGHRWHIGHAIEEVSPEEMQRRYTEMMRRG